MLAANEILVIGMMLGFILLLFTGIPVAWVLAGVSLLTAAVAIALHEFFGVDTYFFDSWRDYRLIVQRVWNLMSNAVLVALPMFIFMGLMLDRSGVAEKLMREFVRGLGRVRGGLAMAVVLVGVLLAASTGIVGASVVLLATISLPILLESGYSKSLAAGVVAASGTLGILVPPSIMLIVMADQMALSVGDLFMGAVFPGLILGGFYLLYVAGAVFLRPHLAPPAAAGEAFSWRSAAAMAAAVLPPLCLIVAVLGSIFLGIATPTEASGLGALGACLLAACNRRLSVRVIYDVARQTTLTTAFIFAIFIGATAFALVARGLGGDALVTRALASMPFGAGGVVLTILFFAFLAGFFLDWLEITLIFLPLISPVIDSLQLNPIWFIVLFAVALQTSFITPPVGFSLFYLKGAAPPAISTPDIYRGIVPFVIVQLLVVGLVFTWPQLVTWLPATVNV